MGGLLEGEDLFPFERVDRLAPDGRGLGTRVLLHPHVGELPFTRSLGGVAIREDIDRVSLRAHDSVHGLGGVEIAVELTR